MGINTSSPALLHRWRGGIFKVMTWTCISRDEDYNIRVQLRYPDAR